MGKRCARASDGAAGCCVGAGVSLARKWRAVAAAVVVATRAFVTAGEFAAAAVDVAAGASITARDSIVVVLLLLAAVSAVLAVVFCIISTQHRCHYFVAIISVYLSSRHGLYSTHAYFSPSCRLNADMHELKQ